MNLLIITPYLPYPLDAGGNMAQYFMIDYLRAEYSITLVCSSGDTPSLISLKKLWPDVEILVSYFQDTNNQAVENDEQPSTVSRNLVSNLKSVLKIAYDTFFKNKRYYSGVKTKIVYSPKNLHPLSLYWDCPGAFTSMPASLPEIVNKILERKKIDLIEVNFIDPLILSYILPDNIPKIFVHHEIRFVRMEREIMAKGDSFLLDSILLKYSKDQELMLIDRFDYIATLSEVDKHVLMKHIDAEKIFVSPFSASVSKSNTSVPFVFANKLVYMGSEKHYPNKDAVEWFLKHIWAHISRQYPDLQFHITGFWEEATVDVYKSNNIHFTGFVENLEDILQGAIMVVPLRIGSGVRSKILEAFANGVPVVTTSIGVEGIPTLNQECLVADTPMAFSSAVLELIADSALQNKLINNATHLVTEKYSQQICGNIRVRTYKEIIQKNHEKNNQ